MRLRGVQIVKQNVGTIECRPGVRPDEQLAADLDLVGQGHRAGGVDDVQGEGQKQKVGREDEEHIVPGVMIVINTMLYGKLDPGIKKDVTSIAGDKARDAFDLMKTMIESIKQMGAKSKTVPMDLSILHGHSTYVKWNDDGAPEDWQEEWLEGADDEAYWEERESYRLAAIVEAEQTLDALKGKGQRQGGGEALLCSLPYSTPLGVGTPGQEER